MVQTCLIFKTHKITRMHSSRMRTACLLPVSPSMHCYGGCTCLGGCTCTGGCTCPGVYLPKGGVPAHRGVYLHGEVYLPGGYTCSGGVPARGVYLPRGCICPGGRVYLPGGCTCPGRGYLPRYSPLWTEWQTGAKILPCPKLRLRAVIIGCISY